MSASGTWQLTVRFRQPIGVAEAEALGGFLISLGSPAAEEKLVRRRITAIRADFSLTRNPASLQRSVEHELRRLADFFPALRRSKVSLKRFTDQAWKERWKKFAKPVVVDPLFAVIPSHIRTRPKGLRKEAMVLTIDPGMAFGTGNHPTTFLCLRMLRAIPITKSFLDVGTGTGVLAIAADKLGFTDVTAVDIDPDAIAVARENAGRHESRDVTFFCGGIDRLPARKTYDVIFANILLRTIIELLPRFKRLLKRNGVLVLSGLLAKQEKDIRRALRLNGLRVRRRLEKRRWIALFAHRWLE